MRIIIGVALAGLLLCAAGYSQEDIRSTIERLNREYTRAYNAGELDKVLDFFAEDAMTLSPEQAPVRGREALRRYYAEAFQRERDRDLALTSIRVETSGDMCYDAGQWTESLPTPDGKSRPVTGYYLGVYRRIGGQWKIVANTFNFPPGI